MKGIVFTEFLEMVAQKFSENMVDDILEEAKPASGGAYTAVGTYDHTEIVRLVQALSARSGLGTPDLLRAFGEYLFGRFATLYPRFFKNIPDPLVFLSGIEEIIHAEVLKLYPDAQLPKFDIETHGKDRLTMVYKSGRHFEDLAEGLIRGCIEHFGQPIDIQRVTMGDGPDRAERFELTRRA
jgi:hypothetical protein